MLTKVLGRLGKKGKRVLWKKVRVKKSQTQKTYDKPSQIFAEAVRKMVPRKKIPTEKITP